MFRGRYNTLDLIKVGGGGWRKKISKMAKGKDSLFMFFLIQFHLIEKLLKV